jgi:hypothetical protein
VTKRSVLLVVAACATAMASDKGMFYDFPSYAGTHLLCQEHVLAKGMEIHWRSFGAGDEVAKVVAFYEKATGKKAEGDANGGFTVRASENAVLTVYAPAKVEAYPHCSERPGKNDRAVILVSTATRR